MSKERLLPYISLEGNDDEKSSCLCFKSMHDRVKQFWSDSYDFSKKALEMGRNDPRKVIYAIKMGFALALVSLLIFWKKPLPDVSQFSIWAILTVIVMFEFSIGVTFIKGFNRGLGTFCAGMLAFLFAALSLLAGQWEKVVIVISFFIIGCSASYLRLYPTMAPYDYGYRVFVLTYCILMVAGNRTREYTVAILTRSVLIAVGACICFIINICIYPIWAGDDLHRLVVNNFKELENSLEGCVDGYLIYVNYDRTPTRYIAQASDDQLYLGYKSVIESAGREKTFVKYFRICCMGTASRALQETSLSLENFLESKRCSQALCLYVMALHGCILSEIQAPPEKRQIFHSQLQKVSAEGAKVLREIGNKIEKMEKLGTVENILKEVHEAGEQQKKIDQRSFLLVNSESWEIGNYTKELEDLADLPSERDYENLQLGFKSLSETAIYIESPEILAPRLPNKDLPKQNLRKHVPRPSWISFEGDNMIKDDEVKTYQSASALSLATFASLLIEFVARLQNVVDCFEELSEETEFKDPNIIVLTESAGFWTRLLRCFRFKS